MWWLDHASIPPLTKGRSRPNNSSVFPPSSLILPSFVWFYIFFSSGQVLLSALSWCSACISVWRCVPDVSMERHVLHLHLLLCHLLISPHGIFDLHCVMPDLLVGACGIFMFFSWRVWSVSDVAQSCLTLCDPMDCSLPGSPVHGIFQARILEWGAISFSSGSSQPRDQSRVSCIVGRRFTI